MSTHDFEPCGVCQTVYAVEDLTEFDEMLVCPECLSENTVICAQCGERIWAEADAGDEHTHLCQRCYDRYYTSCERCNRVILESDAYYEDDDGEPMCYDCHCDHRDNHAINDYYFKPEPIFYGNGSRYFGVELEIDEGGESDSRAKQLISIANYAENRMYCKHDGSLDDGFEMVTHPMTLEYHIKQMPWTDILSKARSLGYRSHQSNTCGLHIHVNRSAFGTTEAEQDACIARVLYFVEKHWEELLKFSRRSRRQMDQWAARYGYPARGLYLYASTEEILKKALRRLPFDLGTPVRVDIRCGELLRINRYGNMSRSNFDASNLFPRLYDPWADWPHFQSCTEPEIQEEYLNDLKAIAACHGLFPEDVDKLLADGFTAEDIEEYIYCGAM